MNQCKVIICTSHPLYLQIIIRTDVDTEYHMMLIVVISAVGVPTPIASSSP